MIRRAFVSYSHSDERYRSELEKCLHDLKSKGIITIWTDHSILPGTPWEEEIEDNLDKSDIFIPLISRDFLASEYCQRELQLALKRHDAHKTIVIPIIVRHCTWTHSPIAKMQVPRYVANQQNGVPYRNRPIDPILVNFC